MNIYSANEIIKQHGIDPQWLRQAAKVEVAWSRFVEVVRK